MNKLVTNATIGIINRFREVCVANGFNEETAVPVVSHHDPSIRFTNSTTSVFKPFLQGTKEMGDGVFLIQPAIGLQGVEYWSKSHSFGPFSSFFYSSLPASFQTIAFAHSIKKSQGKSHD